MSRSSVVATDRYVAASGRGRPGGGIDCARSLPITRSQTSAFALGLRGVERVERKSGGAQSLVVTGDAGT